MSEAIATKLDEARALIERGWCQQDYAFDGRLCSIGAINLVVSGDPFLTERDYANSDVRALASMVERANNIPPGELTDWNDASRRRKREVIEAFRKAAELARSA